MDNKKPQKTNKTYECRPCQFCTSNLKDYNRHLKTSKHSNLITTSNCQTKQDFICSCNKRYKHLSSLCYHMKQTNHERATTNQAQLTNEFVSIDQPQETISPFEKIILILTQQNHEYKNLFIEQTNKILEFAQKPSTIITQNQQNNNHFNINVFLNEKCKDAMNIKQFVEQLVIDADTVQYSGTHGFVAGVTNVIKTGLDKLDQFTRPFHCVDLKREIMYVKIDDTWLKDVNNAAMMNIITHVIQRNMGQIPAWAEANPESNIVGSDLFEAQFTMLREVTGGSGDRYRINTEKVFRNLAKETLIDKTI